MNSKRFRQKNVTQADKAIESINPSTAFHFLVRLLLPELGKYAERTAYVQNAANMARMAIALERYRLAHGGFPESLDALAPQFMEKIPHEIINGQPLHYRRSDDGQFVLYSVGWNETDDGGVVAFERSFWKKMAKWTIAKATGFGVIRKNKFCRLIYVCSQA